MVDYWNPNPPKDKIHWQDYYYVGRSSHKRFIAMFKGGQRELAIRGKFDKSKVCQVLIFNSPNHFLSQHRDFWRKKGACQKKKASKYDPLERPICIEKYFEGNWVHWIFDYLCKYSSIHYSILCKKLDWNREALKQI